MKTIRKVKWQKKRNTKRQSVEEENGGSNRLEEDEEKWLELAWVKKAKYTTPNLHTIAAVQLLLVRPSRTHQCFRMCARDGENWIFLRSDKTNYACASSAWSALTWRNHNQHVALYVSQYKILFIFKAHI